MMCGHNKTYFSSNITILNVKIKYEIVLECFRCLAVPEFKNIKNPFEFHLNADRSIFVCLMCGARVILFLYT